MTTIRPLTLCLLTLALAAATTTARASDAADDVRTQVRGFYHWYVHVLNTKPGAEPRKSAVVHRYVSERLLKDIARQAKSEYGLESDPFLSGQDWDPDWEKNIAFKAVDARDAGWSVQVELTGKQIASQRLNLAVVREGGKWKIDKVSDGNTPR